MIEEVKSYKTSDGQIHISMLSAQLHQEALRIQEYLQRQYGGLEAEHPGTVWRIAKHLVSNRREVIQKLQEVEDNVYDKYDKPTSVTNKIGGMRIGETGYAVPWALEFASDGSLGLDSDYSLHDVKGGTVQMKVSRDQYGWSVDVRGCGSFSWNKKYPTFPGLGNVPVYACIGSMNIETGE